jgi:hypothetical protein
MPSPTRRYYSSTAVATTLSSSISNSATSITVGSVTGWPGSYPFTAIIGEDTAKEELVTVTNVAGTVLTVTRGVGGTSAQAHDAGETIRHGVYAQDFEDGSAHYAASSAVHGVSGSVVGTTDTQTLTNKTISGSSNTLSNVPVSSLTGAWSAWTPTWTNFTVGNGTVQSRYLQIGKTVSFELRVDFGSTTALTTTQAQFTLPVAANSSISRRVFNGLWTTFSGAAKVLFFADTESSTTVAKLYFMQNLNTYEAFTSTNTGGFYPGSNDEFVISGTYEAA